jgi:hypothetical protein
VAAQRRGAEGGLRGLLESRATGDEHLADPLPLPFALIP